MEFNPCEEWNKLHIIQSEAGTVIYPPGGRYGPRIQKGFQLVLLHSGKMAICIDGVLHHVPPGHVALLKPGRLEQFSFAEDTETWHRWIQVNIDSAAEQWVAYMDKLPLYLPISDEMNKLTDMMLKLKSADHPESEALRSLLGRAAIQLFMLECKHIVDDRHKHPAVLYAKCKIENHYNQELSLSNLAQAANMTPEHLARLFRKEEGMTPTQYLWHYRIKRAVELLGHSGLNVGEIAERTGFRSSYHFSRMVKKVTGKTPTQIRQEQ